MPPKGFTFTSPETPASRLFAGAAVLFGVAVFSYGFWLAWRPLGFIAMGVALCTLGVLVGRKAAGRRP